MLDDISAVFARFEDLTPGESAFGPGPAWWFGNKEVAHIDGPYSQRIVRVDLRVTRKVISSNRTLLKAHPGVELRSGTSDWVELTVSSPENLELLRTMTEWLVAAYRELGINADVAPPSGAALERRRRFH